MLYQPDQPAVPTFEQLQPLIDRSERIFRIGGRPILAAKLAASGQIVRLPNVVTDTGFYDQWRVPASEPGRTYTVSIDHGTCECGDWGFNAPEFGYHRHAAIGKLCKHVLACIFLATFDATDGNLDPTPHLRPLFEMARTSERNRLELVVESDARVRFNPRGRKMSSANREVITQYRIHDHNWIALDPSIIIGGGMGDLVPDIPALFDHFWPIVADINWKIHSRQPALHGQQIWTFGPWEEAPEWLEDDELEFDMSALYGSIQNADQLMLIA